MENINHTKIKGKIERVHDIIYTYKWDIFDLKTDAIVNPANDKLWLPMWLWLMFWSHINEKIRKLWWKKVITDVQRQWNQNLWNAITSIPWDLSLKYNHIIHASVLWFFDFNPLFLLKLHERTNEDIIRKAVINSLIQADLHDIKSIAFPLFWAWIWWMKQEKALNIMIQAIKYYFEENKNSKITQIIISYL